MLPEMIGIWDKTMADRERIKTVCAAPYLTRAG
jgi:hypothetical protein